MNSAGTALKSVGRTVLMVFNRSSMSRGLGTRAIGVRLMIE